VGGEEGLQLQQVVASIRMGVDRHRHGVDGMWAPGNQSEALVRVQHMQRAACCHLMLLLAAITLWTLLLLVLLLVGPCCSLCCCIWLRHGKRRPCYPPLPSQPHHTLSPTPYA
jgi:hypothetical protein